MGRLEVGSGTRQERWTQMSNLVAGIEPSQPIDPPVRDVISGLNLFGIETSQCCGGHRDWRIYQGPIVIFFNPRVINPGEEDRYWVTADRFLDVTEQASQVQGYLDEFYTNLSTSGDNQLVVKNRGKSGWIYNRGNLGRLFQDDGPRRRIGPITLRRYQRQMKLFGNFLHEKYLSSEE